ncbi:MAG TPA: penicillin-binding protein 2 [Candidatus Woesebacteria bacterium]|jgi:cell division protein FtsI/penicillin-binding protein 2|nr:penicillin-binding protein 2 [Candidatus Woesebacteria bacterium]HOG37336.1 penicillin-binding protein 2 [Candidatus Woesebacteria bacterium]
MTQRYRILLFSFILCFLAVTGKLFYWQVVKSPELKEKALSQTYKLETKYPARGQILSSDNFPLALNQTNYRLSLYKPNMTENLDDILNKIDLVYPEFTKQNPNLNNFKSNSNQKWVDLSTNFTEPQKNQLQEINGLIFKKYSSRYYPENSLASNMLGFVANDNYGYQTGYGGLEAYYNKQLSGRTGFTWSPQDATGKTILTKKSWSSPSIDGQTILTSINRNFQHQAEIELSQGIEQYQADSGSIIVMETKTGQIVAMTSQTASTVATPSASRNPAISDLFEPGSIFKPIVVTMALDQKSIQPDYICHNCSQPLTIGQYTINNWDKSTHPESTLKDIIKNSDNIGMSNIIRQLGLNNFLKYYQSLGLNQKTGIDLQGEVKPTIKNNWPEIDLATASFGQGIVVTEINMLQAFNTIANDGVLVNPKVATSLSDQIGKVYPIKSKKETRVFSHDSVLEIKSILKYAVENGAVSVFKPKDLEVCAKSGTAQVAVKGGYTDSATIGSYIGFWPCYQPKFTMIVTINNPKSSSWGSNTAAPIWFKMASKINGLL